MKCLDESKLLNYQEPHNYLYRNIKFHKPVQITFFLPPSVFLWGSGRQQEGTSLEELFTHAPVISLDLHLSGEKKNKKQRSRWSFPHFSKCCMCPGGPGSFAFPLSSSVSCSASFFLQTRFSLCSCGCPWICSRGKHASNSGVEKKVKRFQEIAHDAGCSEKIPWDGSLRVLRISVC